MVDKVVQLTDDESNNIYPVAGSLKDGSVTTSTINDGAVTNNKVDFSNFKYPFIGEVITAWDYDVTGGSYTATENCFMVGKGVTSGGNGQAYCSVGGGIVGGIPYTTSGSMIQCAFCFPLAKGQTVEFTVSNGSIQALKAMKMVYS